MRIFKAIVISSLSIPFLVFVIFSVVGLVFLITAQIDGNEHNNGWFGMVYAGAVYGYLALLFSGIPTIAIGWPVSLIAKRLGHLNKKVVLLGSALLGSIFLSVAGAILLKSLNAQIILWLLIAGAVGGLINGVIFLRNLKPKKVIRDDMSR